MQRDEILEKLKTKISPEIKEQCAQHFIKDVNVLINGTNKEMKEFFKNLGGATLCVLATAGTTAAAIITPPAILISPAAGVAGGAFITSLVHTIKTGIGVTRVLKQKLDDGELDLEKCESSQMHVKLWFGVVTIQLKSKI